MSNGLNNSYDHTNQKTIQFNIPKMNSYKTKAIRKSQNCSPPGEMSIDKGSNHSLSPRALSNKDVKRNKNL